MTTTRRAYAGGAQAGALTSPISLSDLSISCDVLTGWPDGTGGYQFAAVIGRGLLNEEKVLCDTRTGAILHIARRGYDGTTPTAHSATETIEHCHTAIDDDEANDHSSQSYGHGIPDTDRIVGLNKIQTLTHKTMDGALNTFINIPESAIPAVDARLDAVELKNTQQDTALGNVYTKAQADAAFLTEAEGYNLFLTPDEAEAQFLSAESANGLYAPLHSGYTKAESDARFAQFAVDSGWSTSVTGFVIQTGWTLTSVRFRTITQDTAAAGAANVTFVDLTLVVQKNATALTIGTKGDVPNTPMVSIPSALRPSQPVGLSGPASGLGRMAAASLDSSGMVTLLAAGGTANIVSEPISVRGFFLK